MFEALYDRLTAYPDSGQLRPLLGSGVRIGIVSPYVVIYRHTDGDSTVAILRIVHGRLKISGEVLSAS